MIAAPVTQAAQTLCTCFYQGNPFAPSNETGLAHIWQAVAAAPLMDRLLVAVLIAGFATEVIGGALKSAAQRVRNNFMIVRTGGPHTARVHRRQYRPGVYVIHQGGGYGFAFDWTARITGTYTRYDHSAGKLRRAVLVLPLTEEMPPAVFEESELTIISTRHARENIADARAHHTPASSMEAGV